jgi:hypothetical protein
VLHGDRDIMNALESARRVRRLGGEIAGALPPLTVFTRACNIEIAGGRITPTWLARASFIRFTRRVFTTPTATASATWPAFTPNSITSPISA